MTYLQFNLNSQGPKIFVFKSKVDFFGNSKVASKKQLSLKDYLFIDLLSALLTACIAGFLSLNRFQLVPGELIYKISTKINTY